MFMEIKKGMAYAMLGAGIAVLYQKYQDGTIQEYYDQVCHSAQKMQKKLENMK